MATKPPAPPAKPVAAAVQRGLRAMSQVVRQRSALGKAAKPAPTPKGK